MDAAIVIERIRAILVEDSRPTLAYVFGSLASGRHTALSDIDIGVLLKPGVDREVALGELTDSLCRHLRTDRIDVVPLDRCSIPVRYRVVRDGTLVHCADRRDRERFESATVLRYLDFKPVRDAAFRVAHDAIVGAG